MSQAGSAREHESLGVVGKPRCRKLLCRRDLPPWSLPPYSDSRLCAQHEYDANYTRRRALGLILRERTIEGDGENHRWLYLLKAVFLVSLFPQRSISYPCLDVRVAACDFSGFPDDFGGSWHEVAVGWGWRPRSWRWEWRGEST